MTKPSTESITLVNLYTPIGRKWNHSFLPLGTLYIAAALEEVGVSVRYRDYQTFGNGNPYDLRKITEFLDTPDRLIGLGCMGTMLPFLLKALEEIKRRDPQKIVVLGGTGVTGLGEQILRHFPQVDVVVSGEGEATAKELFPILLAQGDMAGVAGISYRRNGSVFTTPSRPVIENLESIAQPAYQKVDLSRYKLISFLTSRGCPYKCTFCYSSVFWRRYRRRSIAAVVDEIEDVVKRTGRRNISILDDTILISTPRVLEFCEELQRRQLGLRWTSFGRVGCVSREVLAALRAAGCDGIGFGIESGSDEVLKRIRKDFTREEALETIRIAAEYFKNMEMFFMYGFPFETMSHFNESISLVEDLYQELVRQKGIRARFSFNLVSAVPGTQLTLDHKSLMRRVDLHKIGFYSHEDRHAMVKRRWLVLPSPNASWLPPMLDAHPEVFSGFYRFENMDYDRMARFLGKHQKRYRSGK